MNWQEAKQLLAEGRMVTMEKDPWNGEYFVFKQVPSIIGKEIVPRMQSLPQSVKDEFQRRFDDPSAQISEIYYCDQYALVGVSNRIDGWLPSQDDLEAEDWEEYRP
ncbi:MAG: hypothetical protein PHV20_12435 [Bacteroidales bacterium]|nr:hypothetical protein [Bacteroidales bacterium]